MKVSAVPETPIRLVGKKFRTLYSLVNRLNQLIEEASPDDKIELLQIFFNTVVPSSNSIEFLKLRDGILQVVLPFNWEEFSKLNTKQQQVKFLQLIQKAVNEVVIKYKLDKEKYDDSFSFLHTELGI